MPRPPTTSDLYRTVVHLACSQGNATTEAQAVADTWGQFSGPANVKTWDGRSLCYYQAGTPWATNTVDGQQNIEVSQLLRDGNGQCNSWREFLESAWGVNGVDSQMATVSSPNQYFLVKNWTANTPTSVATAPYVYSLSLTPYANGSSWTTAFGCTGDLINDNGISGQNSATPAEKLFGRHFIQKYNGIYYDPSYGVTYSSTADFQTKAVNGFAVPDDAPYQMLVKLPTSMIEIQINP